MALTANTRLANAIDLQPGDLVAPKPDMVLSQFSYLQAKTGGFYQQGNLATTRPRVDSSQFIVRLGRSFEVSGYPAFFYAQTPMGYIHSDKSSIFNSDAGIGDATFLLALWPYADRETSTYFALGAYLTIPTGNYDANQRINVGENRYKTALQAGYQTPLTTSLNWFAAFDTLWYGDNNNYYGHTKRQQAALYTAQTGLQYTIAYRYKLGLSYFYSYGGEDDVNGQNMGNTTNLQRYQLTATAAYDFGRLTLQYGGDIRTENNYFEDQRLILRYTRMF